jgi:transposase, IS6 family
LQQTVRPLVVTRRTRCPDDGWFDDETYIEVAGRWTYLYRAIDQYGHVIDVWRSRRRDLTAARMFFSRALAFGSVPVEVTTDRALVSPRVLDEPISTAMRTTVQHANNGVGADHGRLKAWLRPMRGLKGFRSARSLPLDTPLFRTSGGATTRSPSISRQ